MTSRRDLLRLTVAGGLLTGLVPVPAPARTRHKPVLLITDQELAWQPLARSLHLSARELERLHIDKAGLEVLLVQAREHLSQPGRKLVAVTEPASHLMLALAARDAGARITVDRTTNIAARRTRGLHLLVAEC